MDISISIEAIKFVSGLIGFCTVMHALGIFWNCKRKIEDES